MTNDGYVFDPFDDGSSKLVGEKQLVKMSDFIESYSDQLKQLEITFDQSLKHCSEFWDYDFEPIALNVTPQENIALNDLITTDNQLFKKIMLVFTSLCDECRILIEMGNDKFVPAFLDFAEKEPIEGEAQMNIGKMIPFLQDFSTYIRRSHLVVQNAIRQLASLYHKKSKLYMISFKEVNLQTVFNQIGDLLVTLLTLDEVIANNVNFKQSWNMYKRMMKTVKSEQTKYNAVVQSEDQFLFYEKFILALEGQIFDGNIFQMCVEQNFDYPGYVSVTKNEVFYNSFLAGIRGLVSRINSEESYQRKAYMGLCCMTVLFNILYPGKLDSKIFKIVWESYKKVHAVHLYGNVSWYPAEFLIRKVPALVKSVAAKGAIQEVNTLRKARLAELIKTLPTLVKSYENQTNIWSIKIESNFGRVSVGHLLNLRVGLLVKGLHLAEDMSILFKEFIGLHTNLGVSLKASYIRPLCKCIELIEVVKMTFFRRNVMIGECVTLMLQQLSFYLQRVFLPHKARLDEIKKSTEANVDPKAAIHTLMVMVCGPSTFMRRVAAKLSMQIYQPHLKQVEIDETRTIQSKIDILSEFQSILNTVSDMSCIYWSRLIISPFLKHVYVHPEYASRIPYIFSALRQIPPVMSKIKFGDHEEIIKEFKDELISMLNTDIINPLCLDIETDLRLHTHSHMKNLSRDPWKTGVKDYENFIRLKPIRILDNLISIKAHVEHYLDKTFYNLNTVALFDWKTYAEMRTFAHLKYNLDLTEAHLPGQTLDQGLDVLEIMRNIHLFVRMYNYNLNNQIFIEKNSEGKSLNTINIIHIANSIRTHGTGILNTTVNFTYQFLRRKFMIFSQFLFDEHIKARLYKDNKFFKENKEKLKSMYPFDRAFKFNREIRNLGVNELDQTYLDQFRMLITEIGNAMGYIRLIRSGGIHYTANAIKFVPDIQDGNIVSFGDLVSTENLSEKTNDSAKLLDCALDNLVKNFAEGTEYFKILIGVFAPEFQAAQNVHFQNFSIIVPPLIVNYIEHILVSKDKLFKRAIGASSSSGSSSKAPYSASLFTDDGFAIGVAYILKVLDQNKEFDSLRWFDSVTSRYKEEKEKVEAKVVEHQ
eukprot:TRINITY_DN4938_c0_g1_i1.p1 TRINITY_DN4938_c0_g1~~TRINITY_DN4938_c0_g1_i1.p1  ORF type:complete len:1098 (+),score=436.48 TRINITY_DN4938_c0_g1_i1:19-3312(+)